MSVFINRNTKQLIIRGNTPDFVANPDWIVLQPDDIAIFEVYPDKYWDIDGDIVSLMGISERNAVDAAELESEKELLSSNLDRVLRAVVIALNKGTFVPGSSYTAPQIKSIIKAEL